MELAPSPIGLRAARYQHRTLGPRGAKSSSEAEPLPTYGSSAVPPLTSLALDALVKAFEAHPNLEGIPPGFVSALTARLPASLDPRLTLPNLHDETYFKRACEEGEGWSEGMVDVRDHGCSWKQAFAERYVASALESFAHPRGVPAGWDERFCRPPIDSVHPEWAMAHPDAMPIRKDRYPVKDKSGAVVGTATVPNRERFCANANDPSDLDGRVIGGSDSGWPYLERLKAIAREGFAACKYEGPCVAWGTLDRAAHVSRSQAQAREEVAAKVAAEEARKEAIRAAAAERAAAEAPAAAAGGGKGGKGAPAKAPPAKAGGGKGGAGDGGSDAVVLGIDPTFLMPPAMKAAAEADAAIIAAQRVEDVFDCAVEPHGNGQWPLREWVTPAQEGAWAQSTAWPPERGESVMTLRSRELQTLLDRLSAAEDCVFRLVLQRLPSHLDLELVLSRLPNLSSLTLTYGPWDRTAAPLHVDVSAAAVAPTSLAAAAGAGTVAPSAGLLAAAGAGPGLGTHLGMLPPDVESLSRCLRVTDSLTHLALPENGITDALAVQLAEGLAANATITHLDLSHNAIGAAGMAALAKLLHRGAAAAAAGGAAAGGAGAPSVLAVLDLSDNACDGVGAQAWARALRKGPASLVSVSLKQNPLGDEGAAAIVDAAAACPELEHLSLACVGAGKATAAAAARVLSGHCSLQSLDLSANVRPGPGFASGLHALAAPPVASGAEPAATAATPGGAGLTQEDVTRIAAAISSSGNARILSLDCRPLEDEGLAATLARNEVAARGGPTSPLTGSYASLLKQHHASAAAELRRSRKAALRSTRRASVS